MKRVALLTAARLPEPDPDADLLRAGFERAGAEARWIAWDDPEADLRGFDLAVVRSTWNYVPVRDAFCAFLERASSETRVFNPARVARWNTDKSYLRELPVPVVPTIYDPIVRDVPWRDVVIKPRVSAGSFATRRFHLPDDARDAEAFLAAHEGMMAQPYMDAVETTGERSLVWIDGAITHAVRKRPRFSGGEEAAELAPIADDERATALAAIAPFASSLLYARCDLVRDESEGDAVLRVMELELVEPSLFLREHPPAIDRLVEGALRRCP